MKEPTETPVRWMSIAAIERYYVHLATGFAIGAINSAEYQQAMEAFKFRDDHDCYWTVGAATGDWYVHDGSTWVTGEPPPELLGADIPFWDLDGLLLEEAALPPPAQPATGAPPPAATPSAPTCPNPDCGEPVSPGSDFCVYCGTRLG